ncbi:MAG: hypothetical protein KAY37_05710 [Phycisphaerae bacterium]|nr:hypothetical protein [Phycisphaerae bacterium]
MQKPSRVVRMGTVAAAAVLFMSAGLASAGTWLKIDTLGNVMSKDPAAASAAILTVEASDLTGLTVRVQTSGLELRPHEETKVDQFVEVTWPEAQVYGEVGDPAIPVIRRAFAAPAGASVSLAVYAGTAVTIDTQVAGTNLLLWPAQDPLPKVPGARENTIFRYNKAEAYTINTDLPEQRVVVQEVGIIRSQRLFQLEIFPVAYNPMKQTLTFYRDITVDIQFDGGFIPRDAVNPAPGFGKVILNPEVLPLVAQRGSGNYLIVVADTFSSAITSFANAKAAQGYTIFTYSVPAGTSNTVIKNYIQTQYNGENPPDYVLLVGDTNLVPHWVGSGTGSPDTDLNYVCVEGSDYFPDIAIGRFPARTSTQLQDIVDKTLYYENGPLADPDYVKRACFMASTDNYEISEGTHNYVIDNYMSDPEEWDVDKLYTVTYGATTQDVRDSFNSGRFYGVFSGHGGPTGWGDGPPFYQSDVAALTNENMYAFICSFSCSTGDYAGTTECFMETWVLEPIKAGICSWGSSVSSYWTEDDILEKVLFDAIFDENQPEVAKEAGPIYNETKLRYFAHFGDSGMTRRYFEMYNLMGDPALAFPGQCSDAGTIVLDSPKYACEDTVGITVADCGLNTDDNVIETVLVDIESDSETGEQVLLTETNPSSAVFSGSIDVSATNAPGVLLVAANDTITATYIDADDGQGNYNVVVTADAVVDCTPPVISNVQAINIEPRSATVTFDSNEMARGVVYYGLSCGSLPDSAGGGFALSPTVDLSGLQDDTPYFYIVEAYDEAGNMTLDDNGGACYTFTTPGVPDFFTEQDPGDLDGLNLLFVPNGSNDFYMGCVTPITALPTDPAGGNSLSLSDDDSELVSPSGTVYLYGTSYNSFYVGSNGYLTFGGSDTEYNESLEDHFDMPRVSALFDDLNPSSGGTVSWKDMGDRVAVTWQNVPEYNSSNSNTFQVELFYDGSISISQLGIASSDHIVGLSEGEGLSPDFYPSDLSNMGSCGPRPPTANSSSVQTDIGMPVTIELVATDDGLPDPPAELTYIVVSLPTHGYLTDAWCGPITTVPHTVCDINHLLVYHPDAWYGGPDSFQWKANDGGLPPEGGDSNIATVSITVGGPQVIHNFPLDIDPGWTTQSQWAFGTPTGGGSHNNDPTSGHTGSNVYGYNLNGDYTDNMARYYLTTAPLDCSEATEVTLKFWRWLGVESASFDHAGVEVSTNGATWTSVWEHMGGSFCDSSWSQYEYDISAVADNQPKVYIRWAMGTTDGSVTYPGWNIDDIEIWGVVPVAPPICPGDSNCDDEVNWRDVDYFVAAMNDDVASWLAMFAPGQPTCPYENNDVNGDGTVNWRDIDPLVALLNTTCP